VATVPKTPLSSIASSRPRGFSRTQTKDRDLQQVQERVAEAVDGLERHVLLGGKLLKTITLDGAADSESVQHGLGKVPEGWQVVSKNAQADIWAESMDEKQIVFRASGPVTVSIYVFG
jgi:hypothetical protein